MHDTRLISKYGYKYIFVILLLLLVGFVFDIFVKVFLVIFILFIFIYRNPERSESISDSRAIYSPLDGNITNIEIVKNTNILDSDCDEVIKITIHNSILNAGQIRAPIDVDSVSIDYVHGLFLCNFMKISNILNEKVIYKFSNQFTKVKMVVFAGVFCKTIHFEKFETIKANKRIAFFVDGKVAIFVPKNISLRVSRDDKITACDVIGFIQ